MARKVLVISIKAVDQISAPIRRTISSIAKLGRKAIATSTRVLGGVKRMAKSLSSVRGLLAGIGVALGARSLIRSILGVSEAIDRTTKSARALGIAVEEYSKLEFVADRAGISTAQLATAFRTAQRNVAQFVRGEGGQAARALKDIDTNLFDANGQIKQGTELLRAILVPLGKIPDEAVRTQKLVDIFGRAGAEMKNLSEDLDGVLADADRFGSITASQARAAESFQDSMANLRRGWLTFKANVLEAIGPVVEDMVNKSAENLAKFGKMVGDFLLTVRAAFGNDKLAHQARRALLQVFDNVLDGARIVLDTGARMLGVVFFAAMDAATQGMGRLTGANIGKELANAFQAALVPFQVATIKFGQLPGLSAAFDRVKNFADEVSKTAHGSGATISDIAGTVAGRVQQAMPAVNREFVRMRDRLLEIAPKFDQTGQLVKIVADSMRQLGIETKNARTPVEDLGFQFSDIWPNLSLGFKNAAKQAKATALQFVQLGNDIFNTLGNQITGGLSDFATGAAKARDAFRNMAKGILEDLTRLIIRMAVFNALGSIFAPKEIPATDLSGTPAGGFPSVGGGFDTAFARSGGLIRAGGHVRRFARGGMVPGPNINRDMVPALLAPGEGVLNRRAVQRMGPQAIHAMNRGEPIGGGITINQHNHFDGQVSKSTARQSAEALMAALLDAMRRHPAFRDQVRAMIT